ncbi:hypothetical protein INT43_004957 [Umbelopsis isabellina]|uniref:Uncharacterized protein n=1 Tax=Mortierella isabellina TaxID=91625 RepID=A0A8H7U7Y6_MORIS|nr:hypothetical protein INT43_004957 [Umbelopsis isabellina]
MPLRRSSSITNEHCDAKRATSIAKISSAQQATNIYSKNGEQFLYLRHEQPQVGTFKVPCSLHTGGAISLTHVTLAQVARDGSCMLIHTFKVTEMTRLSDDISNALCFTASYKIANTSPLLLEEMYKNLQYVRIHPGIQKTTPQYLVVILSRPWCMLEIVLSYSGILKSILETLHQLDGGVYSQPIANAHQVEKALTSPELEQGDAVGRLIDFFRQAKLVAFKEQWWRIVLAHLTRIRTGSIFKSTLRIRPVDFSSIPIIKLYTVDNEEKQEIL